MSSTTSSGCTVFSARAEVQSVDGLAINPVPTTLRMSTLRAMTLTLRSARYCR